MSVSRKFSPSDIEANRKVSEGTNPPSLPCCWQASVLLSPFGDGSPLLENYSQLIVADVLYEYSAEVQALRCRLYLLEDLKYFDFLFVNHISGTRWYWLVSEPGGDITGWYGPFATSLQVPRPDFLGSSRAKLGNSWPLLGVMTDGWVVPTNDPPTRGSWFSIRSDNQCLLRILNIDCNNPLKIPILGAFYLVNVPRFVASESGNLGPVLEAIKGGSVEQAVSFPNPMINQRDIQAALANPLSSASCTLLQIQAIIPGLAPAPPQPQTLPQWTEKTFIQGWTIGCDFIPYYTEVHYWWSQKRQRTMFIGYGTQQGKSTYNDRQDTILYSGYTTSPVYEWRNGVWEKVACNPCLPGIGIPRPDFMKADGGTIKATITGNRDFGLEEGACLSVIAADLPRGQGILSLFWFWFTGDQKGVLFSECEFAPELKHDLQLIDYETFEQNASDSVDDTSFPDPCFVSTCTPTTAVARRGRSMPIFRHRV
jgi:hypothetical protein